MLNWHVSPFFFVLFPFPFIFPLYSHRGKKSFPSCSQEHLNTSVGSKRNQSSVYLSYFEITKHTQFECPLSEMFGRSVSGLVSLICVYCEISQIRDLNLSPNFTSLACASSHTLVWNRVRVHLGSRLGALNVLESETFCIKDFESKLYVLYMVLMVLVIN